MGRTRQIDVPGEFEGYPLSWAEGWEDGFNGKPIVERVAARVADGDYSESIRAYEHGHRAGMWARAKRERGDKQARGAN